MDHIGLKCMLLVVLEHEVLQGICFTILRIVKHIPRTLAVQLKAYTLSQWEPCF